MVRGGIAGVLRTAVDCASGNFFPFYDLYGQYYWYDMILDRITMDLTEVCSVSILLYPYCMMTSASHFGSLSMKRRDGSNTV